MSAHEGASVLTAEMVRAAVRRMRDGYKSPMGSYPVTTLYCWRLKKAGVQSAPDPAVFGSLLITGTLTEWFEDCYASAAMGLSSPVAHVIGRTSSGELRITWTIPPPPRSSESGESQDDA